MENSPYIDIHTHRRTPSEGVVTVSNYAQKDVFTEGSNLATVGLHPWFLTRENFDHDFEKLTQLIHNQQVIGIGECGLDKLRGEDLAFQTTAFEAQIRLAESVSKPVIIHCVRAFNEVIAVKKRLKPSIPLIIHGFNKNETVLKELLRHGFFISIGAAILPKKRADSLEKVEKSLAKHQNTEGPSFSKILQQIPLDRLFFETDDAENVSIVEVYQAASEMLAIDLSYLKSMIYENYKKLFVIS
jgi:TatD DNase family protein